MDTDIPRVLKDLDVTGIYKITFIPIYLSSSYTCVVRNSIILSLIYSRGVHLSQNPYQGPLSHFFQQERGEVSI